MWLDDRRGGGGQELRDKSQEPNKCLRGEHDPHVWLLILDSWLLMVAALKGRAATAQGEALGKRLVYRMKPCKGAL